MSESEAVNILPKNNSYLLGQEKAEQILLEGWRNNSLHNSWLISGIEGIGKATLAYRFAKFLLAADAGKKEQYTSLEISENNPVFKLVVNNAHPDLKIIERDYTDTDRRKILKAIKEGEQLSDEEMKGLKKSAFIRVDDVRTINEFLTKRSADNNWRIVIIDSIDDMNPASANAVLKILEEPPAYAVFLLTCESAGQLLPTVLSRAAILRVNTLDEETAIAAALPLCPGAGEDELRRAARAFGGISQAARVSRACCLETASPALRELASVFLR